MIASIIVAQTAGMSLGAVLGQAPPRFLAGHLSVPIVALLSVGSAIGAVVAGGSPTGWVPLDRALVAALGAGVVWLGASAQPRKVLLAAVAASVAAIGSDVHPVAFAASGLVLAAALTDRRDPFLTAVASAMVLQVALRLDGPDVPGLTALAAAVVLAPVVTSGGSRLTPQVRRRLRRTAIVLGVGGVMAAALAGGTALAARSSLNDGVTLLGGGTGFDSQDGGQDVALRLRAADDAFARARGILRWSRAATVVPIVAQHWRALYEGAVSGQTLSRVGARTAGSTTVRDLRIEDGRIPLATLAALGPTLDDAAAGLDSAHRRLSAAESDWLVSPLRSRIRDATEQVGDTRAGVADAARALPLLPALLGDPVPRRYFLMIQTPAELRATGGFMGDFGEITAEGGRMQLSRFGRVLDLYPKSILDVRRLEGPPDYLARYGRFRPEQELGNVNLSPDLPTVARVIDSLYTQAGGQRIDGVIAVDPFALAAFLRVIGPVQVASWPAPITADNVTNVLLFEQYQRIQSPERLSFLADLAQEVWRRLTTGSAVSPRQLFSALAEAVRGKHLQMVTTGAGEESLFDELGVSGRMAPVDGDFLGVVTQNAGGNKLDAYLHRKVDYRAELDPTTGSLRAHLRLTLENRAPASGLPAYVNGSIDPPVPESHNRLYISVYTPWQVSRAALDAEPLAMAAESELGRRVYSTYAVVKPGGSTTLELDFEGSLPKGSAYTLGLHRQPTVEPDDVRTSLVVPSGWAAGDAGSRRWIMSRRFDDDETVRVPVRPWWR